MTDDLDARRSRLSARLISRLALAYERRLNDANQSSAGISKSQKSLLIHLEASGSRVSDIAERMGVSKQAVSRMCQELEKAGYVNRVDDEADGRATKVHFTSRGRRLIAATVEAFETMEQEMIDAMGERDAAQLNRLLVTWASHFDAQSF